jgi:hypothetical protein
MFTTSLSQQQLERNGLGTYHALRFDLDGSYPPEAGKRSFAFDLVSDSLSLLGGVLKVKFRLLQL